MSDYSTLAQIKTFVYECMSKFPQYNDLVLNIELSKRLNYAIGDILYNKYTKTHRIRFSTNLWEFASVLERKETIIHEVSHIIAFTENYNYNLKHPHGIMWKRIHRLLGMEPNRVHKTTKQITKGRYAVSCKCGEYWITKNLITRRLKSGLGIIGICKKCKTAVLPPTEFRQSEETTKWLKNKQ